MIQLANKKKRIEKVFVVGVKVYLKLQPYIKRLVVNKIPRKLSFMRLIK
jgi:hypothetical protein